MIVCYTDVVKLSEKFISLHKIILFILTKIPGKYENKQIHYLAQMNFGQDTSLHNQAYHR